jgi:hypothetical protein
MKAILSWAWRLAIPQEFLSVNSETIFQSRPPPLPDISFQIYVYYCLTILSFDATVFLTIEDAVKQK